MDVKVVNKLAMDDKSVKEINCGHDSCRQTSL